MYLRRRKERWDVGSVGMAETYSQVEHAGLLCGAEILALGDFGVCVELSKRSLVKDSFYCCNDDGASNALSKLWFSVDAGKGYSRHTFNCSSLLGPCFPAALSFSPILLTASYVWVNFADGILICYYSQSQTSK
jgi:hypothetical protein